MTRIEIFQNTNPAAGREFVAVLEALERTPSGKRQISACMNFFGTTMEEAEMRAAEWLAAERAKHIKAEQDAEKRAARMRRTA